MGICPICNGIASLQESCPTCSGQMDDCGRLVNYFDDYSAYMDYELMEQVDGLPHEKSGMYCVHMTYCSRCEKEFHIKVALM